MAALIEPAMRLCMPYGTVCKIFASFKYCEVAFDTVMVEPVSEILV